MDHFEKLAERHLILRGYENPIFEKWKNSIPDFVIEGNIAVEVTKLTKSIEIDGKTAVVDSDQPRFYQSTKNMLTRLGNEVDEETWFIGFRFRRPIKVRENLKKAEAYLRNFQKYKDRIPHNFDVSDSLQITLVRGGLNTNNSFFELGSIVDIDQSGFVLPDLCENISRVALVKEGKARKCQIDFTSWWLLLPNTISYTLKESYLSGIRASINKNEFWDRITLFDPSNPSNYWDFEF